MNRFLISRGDNIMKVRDYVDLVTLFFFVFFVSASVLLVLPGAPRLPPAAGPKALMGEL